MLAGTLIALAGASSALALSYHGQQPQMHKRALGAVAAVGGHANHLKRDFFEEQPTRMARRVNKSIQRRAPTVYKTTANYYATTGGYSACHTYFSDDDMVIALPTGLYPEVNQVSEYCGKTVLATNPATGAEVTLTVQDASWAAEYVTLPKGAFLALGGTELNGEVAITFAFTDSAIVAPSSTSAADVTSSTAARANKVASKASVAVESVAPVEPSTTSVEAGAKVAQTQAAVKVAAIPTTTQAPAPAPTTPAYDEASARSASSASAAAAKASADAASAAASKAEEEKAAAEKAAADKAAQDKAAADKAAADKAAADKAAADKAAADAAWASSSKAAAAAATKAPAPPANNNNGGGQTFTGGFATYYLQNGNAGHCGTVAGEQDKVIALPSAMYANGAHCGKSIRLTRTDNGASVVATVRDSCPSCVNNESLDLSVGAFTAIASESEGMVPIKWTWA